MSELIQFFIEQASLSGNHLAGMLFAAVVVISLFMIFAYQILDLLIKFFKFFKPIKINRIEKIEKVVEVPKYTDNAKEYNEILKRLKSIEEKQGNVQL